MEQDFPEPPPEPDGLLTWIDPHLVATSLLLGPLLLLGTAPPLAACVLPLIQIPMVLTRGLDRPREGQRTPYLGVNLSFVVLGAAACAGLLVLLNR